MQLTRRELLAGASALAAMPALPALARPAADPPAETLQWMLETYPEAATALGVDKGDAAPLKSRLEDRSLAGQARRKADVARFVKAMRSVDLDAVAPDTRIDLEVVRTAFETAQDGFAFPFGDVATLNNPVSYRNTPYVVIQNVGAFLETPQLLDSSHTIESKADAEAYLARMEAYAAQLDGETERLKHDAALGVIAPDFLLDKALAQLKIAGSGRPEDWGVVASVAKRGAPYGEFGARAAKIGAEKIGPALARQTAELARHRATARSDAGVWRLPQGEAYYAWALRAGTTTTMSPDDVHRAGRAQVAELQAQMDAILKKEGYTHGSVGARMTALGKDPKYQFPNTDAGRAQIIAYLQGRIDDMRARMPRAFHTLTPGRAQVVRMAPEVEPGAPGAYGGPGTIDGKVPGKLWINLRTTEIWPRYALADLAYHEAIPGHIWQGEYTFKQPLLRSLLSFNAYSEGWALYAEQLADELGVYDADPLGRLGYLQSLAFRACRMVVDTGLHAKRWTRAQAIEWFTTTNGSSVEEVQGEVDRYCAWPGQACGYKVGHTAINAQRDKARTTLGARFDLRTFDDALVLGGNVPMTVLASIVDRYIASSHA